MTDTTLPPEVAEAMDACERAVDCISLGDQDEPKIVRTHLHRLAEENARLLGELEEVRGTLRVVMPLHEQAMAERDALKARFAEAPVVTVRDVYAIAAFPFARIDAATMDRPVHLVVEDGE